MFVWKRCHKGRTQEDLLFAIASSQTMVHGKNINIEKRSFAYKIGDFQYSGVTHSQLALMLLLRVFVVGFSLFEMFITCV